MEHRASSAVSLGMADAMGSLAGPFEGAPKSASASSSGLSLERELPNVQRPRYYHSRRIRKDRDEGPPKFKKQPGERLLWIIPMIGLIWGLAFSGFIIYSSISGNSYNYCPVLNEDFSSGVLNPRIWTKEVEVGGFGNHQFEETTANEDNVFVQNQQLYIRPTLQDEILITTNNTINLTATGTCTATSNIDFNCVTYTNVNNGTIVQPVKSGRINTKLGASITYGRVEVHAKIPKGDWLWPAIWMMPVTDTYGPWPASGEIDIMEARGNNHTYSFGGNDVIASSLHWGPDSVQDRFWMTTWVKPALHSEFGDAFHTFGLEWTEKYMFSYVDTSLLQVFYLPFNTPFWQKGQFGPSTPNGTLQLDPWSQTERPQTPFDQKFYLIINVAVGGTNGWFQDGIGAKPWLDNSPTAKKDFWSAKDQWYPTWQENGQMIVDSVKMWQQC